METQKPKTNHIEIGIILSLIGIAIFCANFFYFNVIMIVMKFILYLFVLVMIGGAINEFREAINKNKIAGRIKSGVWFTLKKIIFPIGIYGLTARYYYEILKHGIASFDAPMAGIFIAIALALICILYFWVFIRKPKSKNPIGK